MDIRGTRTQRTGIARQPLVLETVEPRREFVEGIVTPMSVPRLDAANRDAASSKVPAPTPDYRRGSGRPERVENRYVAGRRRTRNGAIRPDVVALIRARLPEGPRRSIDEILAAREILRLVRLAPQG